MGGRNQRRELRKTMPNLRPRNAPPTLGRVSETNVEDTEIGLEPNVWVQRAAEAQIRNALDQRERTRRAFAPIVTRIAVSSDEDEDGEDVAAVDVLLAERTVPRSWADEGH